MACKQQISSTPTVVSFEDFVKSKSSYSKIHNVASLVKNQKPCLKRKRKIPSFIDCDTEEVVCVDEVQEVQMKKDVKNIASFCKTLEKKKSIKQNIVPLKNYHDVSVINVTSTMSNTKNKKHLTLRENDALLKKCSDDNDVTIVSVTPSSVDSKKFHTPTKIGM